jgi:hypothetical protein
VTHSTPSNVLIFSMILSRVSSKSHILVSIDLTSPTSSIHVGGRTHLDVR